VAESDPDPDPGQGGAADRDGGRGRGDDLEIAPRRSRLGIEPPTHIDEWDAETVDEIPEAFEIDDGLAVINVSGEGERLPFHGAMLRPVRAAVRTLRNAS
jgi:hypothetical protein